MPTRTIGISFGFNRRLGLFLIVVVLGDRCLGFLVLS